MVFFFLISVVKTRFQLQTGRHSEYNSILGCLNSIIKKEGYFVAHFKLRFRSLYRGIIAPISVEAPKRATKFAANEQYSKLFKILFKREKLNQSLSILTGVCAGTTEAFVVVAFELVKIRMQDKDSVFLHIFKSNDIG